MAASPGNRLLFGAGNRHLPARPDGLWQAALRHGRPQLPRVARGPRASSSSTRTGSTAGTSPLFSDKYFVQDYNIRANSLGADYIRESISTAYLTGQGDRSYFDLRGYRIQGLSAFDDNKQQPLVLPVVNYNRDAGPRSRIDTRRRRRGQRRRQPDEPQPDHGGPTSRRARGCSTRPSRSTMSVRPRRRPTRCCRTSSRRPASCAASRATTRELRRRSAGNASSSTRSARSGNPSRSSGPMDPG